ncbi:MAG: iron-containing redox enzyme family protein [Parvibaculum sp.]|nr:iron-containing redox enzyme family protein [Parvibaculum sp.]
MSIILDRDHFKGWSVEDFIRNLQAYRNQFQYGHHPIVDAITTGELPKEALKSFLIQWWWFGAVGSEQMLPNILADMPIDASLYPVKKKITVNFYEEFFTPGIHPEINVDMIVKGCGIRREDVYRAEILSETSALVAVLERYMSHGWKHGIMALMWSVESQSPIQFERQSKGLREHYGFTDTRFPDIHVEADMEHAGDADDFCRLIVTPDNMMELWNAAADSVAAIWNWHDAMYHRFMPEGRATFKKAA